MPLIADELEEAGPPLDLPQPQERRPPALDVAAAAFRQFNVTSSIYERLQTASDAPAVPGFDPLDHIDGFEPYASRFLYADSPAEVSAIKSRIAGEIADRRALEASGGWGVAASIVAGATDPLSLAGMLIPATGPTRLASALRSAAGAAAAAGADELVLMRTQETRTPQEVLLNVGASTVLAGVLGAAIAPRVLEREFATAAHAIDNELRPRPGNRRWALPRRLPPPSSRRASPAAGVCSRRPPGGCRPWRAS